MDFDKFNMVVKIQKIISSFISKQINIWQATLYYPNDEEYVET